MSKKVGYTSGGIGFCGTLFIVFFVLKVLNLLDWSWVWIFAPLWIPVALVILLLIIALIVAAFSGEDDE